MYWGLCWGYLWKPQCLMATKRWGRSSKFPVHLVQTSPSHAKPNTATTNSGLGSCGQRPLDEPVHVALARARGVQLAHADVHLAPASQILTITKQGCKVPTPPRTRRLYKDPNYQDLTPSTPSLTQVTLVSASGSFKGALHRTRNYYIKAQNTPKKWPNMALILPCIPFKETPFYKGNLGLSQDRCRHLPARPGCPPGGGSKAPRWAAGSRGSSGMDGPKDHIDMRILIALYMVYYDMV